MGNDGERGEHIDECQNAKFCNMAEVAKNLGADSAACIVPAEGAFRCRRKRFGAASIIFSALILRFRASERRWAPLVPQDDRRTGADREEQRSNRERSVRRRGVGRVESETDPRCRPRPSAGFLRVQIGRIWDLGSLRRHPHGGGGEFLIRSARA